MKHKTLTRVLGLVLVVALFVPMLPVQATSAAPEVPAASGLFVPGEIVVGFESGQQLSDYTAAASALAGEVGAQPIQVTVEGTALLRFEESADVEKLAAGLVSQPGVAFAEPNYIFSLPKPVVSTINAEQMQRDYVLRTLMDDQNPEIEGAVVPVENLKAMQSIVNGKVQATYPNDPYLWNNNGYSWVGADIVSSNNTASAGVCVLDTGVDYLHKDLSGKVLKGYDFVNGDTDPMDDYGHGTHVAGIIAAKANNKEGMAGASTAKVVAVKVLDAQGNGTTFDLASGIYFCANRSDVKVLNMSLGGYPDSMAIYSAIDYAANYKNKLLVISAGNESTSTPTYPAYYASYPQFKDKVLAVAASGLHVLDDEGNFLYLDNNSLANYSNYGSWVSVVAPGTDIYSTTPWDRPFNLNYFAGYNTRYDYLSGTSMAAPFVAAAAARRWGYKPLETNAQVGKAVRLSGGQISANDTAWTNGYGYPASMAGLHQIDIPTLLDRFSLSAGVYDASTGLPLVGAQVRAYVGTSLKGSAAVVSSTYQSIDADSIPHTYVNFSAYTDVINLPRTSSGSLISESGIINWYANDYSYQVYKPGYTASSQPAFLHSDRLYSYNNVSIGNTAVPPKSTNFDLVLGFTQSRSITGLSNLPDLDLDLNVWLPASPNPYDFGQPAPFIVGAEGYSFGFLEGDAKGAMTAFPFARLKREGGFTDWVSWEDITISSRMAHSTLSTNSALPYYPGEYAFAVTDWDQTYDHDNNSATAEIPVMGSYAFPFIYVWKDGGLKFYNKMSTASPCNSHWWKAGGIFSSTSGIPTYRYYNSCGNSYTIMPYY